MAILYIFVKPGAKSNSFGFDQEAELWIRIAAPAVENKANEACNHYLAELLGIKKGDVHLVKAKTCRIKGFEIDLSEEKLEESLLFLRSY